MPSAPSAPLGAGASEAAIGSRGLLPQRAIPVSAVASRTRSDILQPSDPISVTSAAPAPRCTRISLRHTLDAPRIHLKSMFEP